jgi:quinone-modifying oxidoreductase subunit QmoA
MADSVSQTILVVGGGMAGMSAALEAAEAGYDVVLIEKNPYLGGRVAQLNQYFPKLCPPYCGLEINFKRMKNSPLIRFYTMCEVDKISGSVGDFTVTLKQRPRYVNEKCTACGECAKATSLEIDDPFNYGMRKIKAAYVPYDMALPLRYVIDPVVAQSDEAQKVQDSCPYGAIEMDMAEKTFDLPAGAIIWATGWQPYDPTKMDLYDFDQHPNVITNVMMERLAAKAGPTEGRILRPSDGKEPKTVAFVQCAGSRDENHLGYCSGICCLASLKHATYVRDRVPDAKVMIFFIDIRATDRMEDFFNIVKLDEKVEFFKGKVAQITENPSNGNPILKVENTMTEELSEIEVDLAVLATGMQPTTSVEPAPTRIDYDDYGFIARSSGVPGIVGAGCVRTPVGVAESVTDGTGAALKAIQAITRR